MAQIRALFDNQEYFEFTNAYGEWTINNNIALKNLTLNAIAVDSFKDFIVNLNNKKIMLADIYINNKLYISGFINNGNLRYSDSANGGTDVTLTVKDRFNALTISDIIKTKPQGTIQNFVSEILKELDFADQEYIDTYQRKINKASDFLINGKDVNIQKLKTFTREDIVQKSALAFLGEALSIHKLLLISNGYDSLFLEKANSYLDKTFTVRRDAKFSNVERASKADNNNKSPSQVIILNSSGVRENDKIRPDSNTSLIVSYPSGLPHIKEVRNVSLNASYQDLAKAVNFRLSGITAKENTFIYVIRDELFNNSRDFFRPNRVVEVYDEKYGINSNMQVLQTSFTVNAANGTTTVLNLTTQNAFDNQSSVKQKKSLMKR